MTSNNASIPIGSIKPKSHVVRALIGRLIAKGRGRHERAHLKRKQALDRMDLDQRVRELGEW